MHHLHMAAKEIMLAMNLEALSLGYCSLKKEQKDNILDFILGNHVLAVHVLPTGFGKAYATPAFPEYLTKCLEALTLWL